MLLGTRATAPASTTDSASDSNSVSDSASDPNSISDSVSGTNSHVHWDPHGPPGGAAGPRRLQQADTSGAAATPSSPGASDQGAPPPPLLVPLLPYGLSNQVGLPQDPDLHQGHHTVPSCYVAFTPSTGVGLGPHHGDKGPGRQAGCSSFPRRGRKPWPPRARAPPLVTANQDNRDELRDQDGDWHDEDLD